MSMERPALLTHYLSRLAQTNDPEDEIFILEELMATCDKDATRTLCDLWAFIPWRRTRQQILQKIGIAAKTYGDPALRGLSFLCSIASSAEDRPMALAAIHGLSYHSDPVAGRFLIYLLSTPSFEPLKKDVILALAQHPLKVRGFIFDAIASDESAPAHLRQAAFYGIGSARWIDFEPKLLEILQKEAKQEDSRLFNAALLLAADIGQSETFECLKQLDLPKERVFAYQLAQNAMARIQTRLNTAPEDMIQLFLKAQTEEDEIRAILLLKEHPAPAMREAFFVLAGTELGRSQEKEALIRFFLEDPAALQEDAAFFKKYPSKHPLIVSSQSFQEQQKMSEAVAAKLLESEEGLKELLLASFAHPPLKTMILLQLSKQLTKLSSSDPWFARLIRFVGDLACGTEEVIALLRATAEQEEAIKPVCYALKKTPHKTAKDIIFKLIRRLKTKEDSGLLEEALGALAFHLQQHPFLKDMAPENTANRVQTLGTIDLSIIEKNPQIGLSILQSYQIPAWEKLILNGLENSDHLLVLLALAAASMNPSSSVLGKCLDLVGSKTASVELRAVYAISLSEHLTFQRDLIRKIQTIADKNLKDSNVWEPVLKVFCQHLSPDPKESYHQVIQTLLQLKKTLLPLYPVWDGVINQLIERIELACSRKSGPSTSKKQTHQIDQQITKSIPSYHSLSSTIKSTIRNAELTFKHSELFDDQVDKSTIVMELTKAIDLLFQEKWGEYFGKSDNHPIFVAMQSRMINLEIDQEDRHAPFFELERTLQLAGFSGESFPKHKLYNLGSVIASGKMLHAPFKFLDGLRAWAILMLIFARSFKNQTVSYEPLLPVKHSENIFICNLSRRLGDLQGIRNNAVHRGTLTSSMDLKEIRDISLQLFADCLTMFE